jgi:zinc protease
MKRIGLIFVLAACGGAPTAKPVAPAAPPPPTAPTELTADQVMEASIAAQGGREAQARIKSLKMTGTLEIGGAKGTVVVISAPPHETLTTLELEGYGTILQGMHNDFAWEKNPVSGSHIMTGPELTAHLRQDTFNADLVWKQLYPKAELQGVVDYNGTQAYKVLLTAADGDTVTRFIAKDTKLELGYETVEKTQMGPVPVSAQQSDFRDVGGVKFPFKLVNKTAGQSFTVILTSVEPNAAIDPKAFEPPDDIKQLAAKPQ